MAVRLWLWLPPPSGVPRFISNTKKKIGDDGDVEKFGDSGRLGNRGGVTPASPPPSWTTGTISNTKKFSDKDREVHLSF